MMSPCKREGWYTKLETKGDIRGSGYMEIVTSPPKKNYVQIFIFRLILFSATAAELCLPFRWWFSFRHWPEYVRAG